MLKAPTLSCKSAVKPNVTGKMPAGAGNITELSGGFRRVIKESLALALFMPHTPFPR